MLTPDKLTEKYNIPVPRYTSYPPANYFTMDYTADTYRNSLLVSNHQEPSNISLYIHVPFCKSQCFYCGCNSCPMETDETILKYFTALKKEISMVKEMLDDKRLVSQVHYGGGTPNSVPVHFIRELNEYIFSEFSFIENPEIAIECHPAYLTNEYIASMNHMGFNRYSLGIQDFNRRVLNAVRRKSPVLPLTEIIQALKDDNKKVSINLDFMYGLPLQTPDSFAETIGIAISHMPERITTFPYAHVPWINSLQEKLEKKGLPGPDSRSAMLESAEGLLLDNGYLKIAMDHFAVKEDELAKALVKKDLHRNFQGYCTRRTTGQVYAFGVSGISQLGNSYAQNVKDVDAYIHKILEETFATERGYELTTGEMVIRTVINELMCNKTLDWNKVAKQHDIKVESARNLTGFNPKKQETLQSDGLIMIAPEEIKVTERGEPFLRLIASAFDPMYGVKGQKFSKPF